MNFDFDREVIDTEDYFYIDSIECAWSNGHTSLDNYNLYLFDIQTQVLKYFHGNIIMIHQNSLTNFKLLNRSTYCG